MKNQDGIKKNPIRTNIRRAAESRKKLPYDETPSVFDLLQIQFKSISYRFVNFRATRDLIRTFSRIFSIFSGALFRLKTLIARVPAIPFFQVLKNDKLTKNTRLNTTSVKKQKKGKNAGKRQYGGLDGLTAQLKAMLSKFIDPLFRRGLVFSTDLKATVSYYEDRGTGAVTGIQVWCYDKHTINKIWENGNFGKGILSRSEPTFKSRYEKYRQKDETIGYVEELTWKRRAERQGTEKRIDTCFESVNSKNVEYMEPMQLSCCETLFLSCALGCMELYSSDKKLIPAYDLWRLILTNDGGKLEWDNRMLLEYVVYYHYRSAGWIVRSGIKFAVDFLLYESGPRKSHSKFAVKIIPVYHERHHETRVFGPAEGAEIIHLHSYVRLCSQVRKTLLLCYVYIPEKSIPLCIPEIDLSLYRIHEIKLNRFEPNANREAQ